MCSSCAHGLRRSAAFFARILTRDDGFPILGVRRHNAMISGQIHSRRRHESGHLFHEFQRCEHDVSRCIAVGLLEPVVDLAALRAQDAIVADGRPGHVAAELLQFLRPIGRNSRIGVQVEAAGLCAARAGHVDRIARTEAPVPLHTQPGAGAERDAADNGGAVTCCEGGFLQLEEVGLGNGQLFLGDPSPTNEVSFDRIANLCGELGDFPIGRWGEGVEDRAPTVGTRGEDAVGG